MKWVVTLSDESEEERTREGVEGEGTPLAAPLGDGESQPGGRRGSGWHSRPGWRSAPRLREEPELKEDVAESHLARLKRPADQRGRAGYLRQRNRASSSMRQPPLENRLGKIWSKDEYLSGALL